MKKWIPIVAGVLIVLLGLVTLASKEALNKKTKLSQELNEVILRDSGDEVKASLKSVSQASLNDFISKGNGSEEISLPVTLKIAKSGNGWKVSGIELANDDLPQKASLAQPVVRGATLTSVSAVKTEAKTQVSAAQPEKNVSAYAIYFLANGSEIGTKGSQTVSAISKQAKESGVKQVLLRGYSERDILDAHGKSVAGRRADAVKLALEKAGVDPAKIQIEKAGKSPDGYTPRQKRRVEIVLQ